MRYGVECFVDGERLFVLEADSVEPDLAREIAVEVLEAHLKEKVLGGNHGMKRKVTRIVVAAQPMDASVVRSRRERGNGL
jgi:hypothetical protein